MYLYIYHIYVYAVRRVCPCQSSGCYSCVCISHMQIRERSFVVIDNIVHLFHEGYRAQNARLMTRAGNHVIAPQVSYVNYYQVTSMAKVLVYHILFRPIRYIYKSNSGQRNHISYAIRTLSTIVIYSFYKQVS